MCKINRGAAIVVSPLKDDKESKCIKEKRVAFNPTVKVCVVKRLDAFACRDLFYQPADFDRFRSEACIEILEARADREREPWKSMLRRLKEFVSNADSFITSQEEATAYQYYRSITTLQKQHLQQRRPRVSCTAELSPKSPETIVRELAFVL